MSNNEGGRDDASALPLLWSEDGEQADHSETDGRPDLDWNQEADLPLLDLTEEETLSRVMDEEEAVQSIRDPAGGGFTEILSNKFLQIDSVGRFVYKDPTRLSSPTSMTSKAGSTKSEYMRSLEERKLHQRALSMSQSSASSGDKGDKSVRGKAPIYAKKRSVPALPPATTSAGLEALIQTLSTKIEGMSKTVDASRSETALLRAEVAKLGTTIAESNREIGRLQHRLGVLEGRPAPAATSSLPSPIQVVGAAPSKTPTTTDQGSRWVW